MTTAPRYDILHDSLGHLVATAMLSPRYGKCPTPCRHEPGYCRHVVSWDVESTTTELGRAVYSYASLIEARLALEAVGITVSAAPVNPHGSYGLTHMATAAAIDEGNAATKAEWQDAMPCYLRYGDLPQQSYDHRDQRSLSGVSVFRGHELPDGRVHVITASAEQQAEMYSVSDRPLYVVSGTVVGAGPLGEPVLADARIVRQVSP